MADSARTAAQLFHRRDLRYRERDDENYLAHSLAHFTVGGAPSIRYMPVVITKSQPAKRVYGGEGKQAVLT